MNCKTSFEVRSAISKPDRSLSSKALVLPEVREIGPLEEISRSVYQLTNFGISRFDINRKLDAHGIYGASAVIQSQRAPEKDFAPFLRITIGRCICYFRCGDFEINSSEVCVDPSTDRDELLACRRSSDLA